MDFLIKLFSDHSPGHSILMFGLVASIGLALGSINVWGVRLGIAGVLFSGILFAHFGVTIDPEVLHFCRDFGLMLFVYTVGMQVGPGFLSSLKRDGLKLNLLAGFVVFAGFVITILLHLFLKIPMPAAVGMFSGATTNTPSLGAAQEALKGIADLPVDSLELPSLAYAVSYPFGIMGIILTMILVRLFFKINVKKELDLHHAIESEGRRLLSARNIRVDNSNVNGISILNLPNIEESGVVISRVLHDGKVKVALGDTKLYVGDVIYAVGTKEKLDDLQMIVGSQSDVDIRQVKSNIVSKRVIVTRPEIVGKTIEQLRVWERYGITITRISRAEIEFAVSYDLQLQFADTLIVVGEEEDIAEFSDEIGNSIKQLDHPFMVPLFVGLVLGVIVGSIPFNFPGVPSPVKLGLAGGPLIVAIILGRIGRIGNLIWYMPAGANHMLRELGIILFLACVGLKSGGQFVSLIVNGQGLFWMASAALITLIPIALMAIFARIALKMNYLTVCGILAGSMTDPPALAFANTLAVSNAPAIAYATVYPLVMLLRVVFAQILVIYFVS